MNSCIIGIGSNIDPEKNIERVLDLLRKEVRVVQVSSFVKTAPLGMADQPDFINGAVKAETATGADEFRRYLKELEDRLGRDRSQPKSGPRCIDLDILVWNGVVVDNDYYTRDFLRDAAAELGFTPFTS
ncbi:MAG: 2-amino-4-hydroxy-6-hydroxymethyldihydropteridine diphosphokinase [Prolixibacteraceae bacterium]